MESGNGVLSTLHLSKYAYKCHYLPNNKNITSLIAIKNTMAQGVLIIYFV
jgi:hypothetical protein